MAQKGTQFDRGTFSCSICLDLLKGPVALPCGHSYCMDCIKSHWDGENEEKIYSCPQCRQTFSPRPALTKNAMLEAVVGELKKTGLRTAAVADVGPYDVACDVCTGTKLKAVKSCQVCMASYCETHLRSHWELFQKHKLVEPSKQPQENICPVHNEVMKMFCRTDQQCICYLCSMDEHTGHDTVSAAVERTEKQKEHEVSRQNIQKMIQDREKDVKVLQREVEAINGFAGKAVENGEKTFAEMIRLLQKRRTDVKQQVRFKQEAEVSRVRELQDKLKLEIVELQRKDAEFKKLSSTENHIQFLHQYPSVSPLTEYKTSSIDIRPQRYFEDVTADVTEVRDKLLEALRETWSNVSLTVTEVDVLLSQAEPTTRTEFLRYSRQMTLDPNTAAEYLFLSEGNRKATRMKQPQRSCERERFPWPDDHQVLSAESLTGRCYWEVEWKGIDVLVAAAYSNSSRKGSVFQLRFGLDDKSWALQCSQSGFHLWFNNSGSPVKGPVSSRVGLYLDHSAGSLSFYSVSQTQPETMTLLCTVQTEFTQPLYAGLGLMGCIVGHTAELCKLT